MSSLAGHPLSFIVKELVLREGLKLEVYLLRREWEGEGDAG